MTYPAKQDRHVLVMSFTWSLIVLIQLVSARYLKAWTNWNMIVHSVNGLLAFALTCFGVDHAAKSRGYKLIHNVPHAIFGVCFFCYLTLVVFGGIIARVMLV